MQAMEAHLTPCQIDYDAADNHIICIEHNTANTTGCMIAKASTTKYSDNFDDFADPVEKRDLDMQWEMLGTQVCSQNTSHQPQLL